MPENVGPQPPKSVDEYQKLVQDYKDAQHNGANLPAVAYDQPGQVVAPAQLPDPSINLRAGFAPQDISSLVVLPHEEALAHPSGPEAGDWFRSQPKLSQQAAEWAAENAEEYDERKRLSDLTAPEREHQAGQSGGDKGSSSTPASRSSRSSSESKS